MHLKVLFVILFIGGIIFVLTDLPIVTGRGIEEVQESLAATETIELSGNTLFLSDLHLTADPALEEQFNLDFSDARNVVMVGDFFHSAEDFWSFGVTEEEAFRAVLGEIVPKDFSGNIYFIHATTHDPQNLQTQQLSFDRFEFFHLGRYGKFSVNGTPVAAYHGEQLHGGMIGGGVSWLAKLVGQEMLLERLGKQRFGVAQDTWVINGHSHVSGIDKRAKAANPGSFVGAPFNKFVWRLHIGSGILFQENGEVELQEYEGLNIKKLYPFVL